MMLSFIFQTLGLDARDTVVLIIMDSLSEGKHTECQINLPNGLILRVDANYSNYYHSSRSGLSLYNTSVGILVPTIKVLSYEDLKNYLLKLRVTDETIIWQNKGPVVYSVIGESHRLTSQGKLETMYSKHNLAVLIHDNIDSFIGSEFGKTREEVIKSAARFYQEAIKDNPENIIGLFAKFNLASLSVHHIDILYKTKIEKLKALKKAEKYLEDIKQNSLLSTLFKGKLNEVQNLLEQIHKLKKDK